MRDLINKVTIHWFINTFLHKKNILKIFIIQLLILYNHLFNPLTY